MLSNLNARNAVSLTGASAFATRSVASDPVTGTQTRGSRSGIRREIKLGVPVIALSRSARYYRRVIADATTDYNNCPVDKLFSVANNNTSVTLTHPISVVTFRMKAFIFQP